MLIFPLQTSTPSEGRLLQPRLPSIMLASKQLYHEVRAIFFSSENVFKLVGVAGTLSLATVARLRRLSNNDTKATKISRLVRLSHDTTCYIDFEARLSDHNTVLLHASAGKATAITPPGSFNDRHAKSSGRLELCSCEIADLADSIAPATDAVLSFLEAYLARVGPGDVSTSESVRRDGRLELCGDCGTMKTSVG